MTNAEAWFNKSLRPRKPEGSLGRTAQDVHLDSHTAPELCSKLMWAWYLYVHMEARQALTGVHNDVIILSRSKVLTRNEYLQTILHPVACTVPGVDPCPLRPVWLWIIIKQSLLTVWMFWSDFLTFIFKYIMSCQHTEPKADLLSFGLPSQCHWGQMRSASKTLVYSFMDHGILSDWASY